MATFSRVARALAVRPQLVSLEDRLTPATFWVATNGKDGAGHDGLSTGKAFLTIQRAIDAANANPGDDTIKVRNGTYTSDRKWNMANLNNTSPAHTTIVAENPRGATLDATGLPYAFQITGSNYTVEGFKIRNGKGAAFFASDFLDDIGMTGIHADEPDDPTPENEFKNINIVNNEIFGFRKAAINLMDVEGFKIVGNDIHDNCNDGPGFLTTNGSQAGAAITIEEMSSRGVIERNRVYNNYNEGSGYRDFNGNGTFEDSEFVPAEWDANGIILGHKTNKVRVAQNIVYDNHGVGILMHGGNRDIDVVQNTFARNGYAWGDHTQIKVGGPAKNINVFGNIAVSNKKETKPIQIDAGIQVATVKVGFNLIWVNGAASTTDVNGWSGTATATTIHNTNQATNIVARPNFVSVALVGDTNPDDDFKLSSNSPAINAISGPVPTAYSGAGGLLAASAKDFHGGVRRNGTTNYDIGADEFE